MEHTQLTPLQKINAVALKYYSGLKWEPKVGDYYTTPRADLELYKIVSEDEEHFYTVYCDRDCEPAQWKKSEFLEGFGLHRTWVHPSVFNIQ